MSSRTRASRRRGSGSMPAPGIGSTTCSGAAAQRVVSPSTASGCEITRWLGSSRRACRRWRSKSAPAAALAIRPRTSVAFMAPATCGNGPRCTRLGCRSSCAAPCAMRRPPRRRRCGGHRSSPRQTRHGGTRCRRAAGTRSTHTRAAPTLASCMRAAAARVAASPAGWPCCRARLSRSRPTSGRFTCAPPPPLTGWQPRRRFARRTRRTCFLSRRRARASSFRASCRTLCSRHRRPARRRPRRHPRRRPRRRWRRKRVGRCHCA
mmetsp:Transcript_31500/g.104225  ORF Transcript_31500/g.104225 Transcript_31500/m.104225 type:complete len:264 (-) Transcript_31500:194-985(-)